MTTYYKKQLNDYNRFAGIREKVLDKRDELLYNTRIRSNRVDTFVRVDDVNEFTIDPLRTEACLQGLHEIMNGMNHAYEASGADTGKPFIAGGAVRDTLLGVSFKDVDVFIPNLPPNDLDDSPVYLTELYREYLFDVLRESGKEIIRRYPVFTKVVGGEYQNASNFTTYRGFGYVGNRIGRKALDVMACTSSVEDVVSGFDYDLVKAYYTTEGFFVSEGFIESLKKKRVNCKDQTTNDRATRWRNRTRYPITIGRPPKVKADPDPAVFYGNYNTSWVQGLMVQEKQFLRVMDDFGENDLRAQPF